MQYRVGVCSNCGAQFRVPATFEASKAKCKSCGGVVGVGPVVDVNDPEQAPASPAPAGKAKAPAAKKPAAKSPRKKAPVAKASAPKAAPRKQEAQPIPARKPAPAAKAQPVMEEIVPKKKKRTGPSMKERLLAQRQAELEAAGSAGAKVARSGKTAPSRQSSGRPVAKKVARPAGRAAAKVAAAGKVIGDAVDEDAPKPRRGTARSSGASSRGRSRSSARRPARTGRRGASDEEGSDRRRGRSKKSKSNPAPIVAGVALLAVGGFAVWKFVLNKDDSQTVAAAGSENDPAGGDEAALAAGVGDASVLQGNESSADALVEANDAEEAATPETDEDATGGSVDGDGEAATEDPGTDEPEGSADATEPEDSEKSAGSGSGSGSGKDPDSVDLSVFEDFGKLAESSDEEWAELQQQAATMIDPEAGAAGNRAKMALLEMGKPAVPAVLNVLKGIDVSTDQGYRDGDLCQKLMQDICNGRNFGWKYSTEREDQYFNKRVIEEWCKAWTRCKDDEKFWLWFAKLEDEKPSAEGDGEGSKTSGSKRLKALDALEDDE